MKLNISTIPIEEGFSQKCGCPLCNLEIMLETRCIDYVTGSAMMEPEVRAETDCNGFCDKHLEQVIESERRQHIALVLQTHLNYIERNFFDAKQKKPDKKYLYNLEEINKSCYVCDKMQEDMNHLLETLLNTWIKDDNFKQLFASQEYICFKHYQQLAKFSSQAISSKYRDEFFNSLKSVAYKGLVKNKVNIDKFCTMFDYRSRGMDFSDVADSIENTADYLVKRKNTDKVKY